MNHMQQTRLQNGQEKEAGSVFQGVGLFHLVNMEDPASLLCQGLPSLLVAGVDLRFPGFFIAASMFLDTGWPWVRTLHSLEPVLQNSSGKETRSKPTL